MDLINIRPLKRKNLMGESKKDALRVNFDRKLKLEFHGVKVTSDAGLLAMIESELTDSRTGKNTRHGLLALLRQSVYSRLAGYDDTNDAERMSVDPAMRQVVGGRAKERTAASFICRLDMLNITLHIGHITLHL